MLADAGQGVVLKFFEEAFAAKRGFEYHSFLTGNDATDFERVTRLHEELRDVESEREALEDQWLEAAELAEP